MEFISKELIVNELKRRIDLYNKLADTCAELNFSHSIEASRLLAYQYENLLDFLNSLEVKEVDLKKVIDGLTAGWIEGEEYGELQNINTCRCVTLGEVKEAMRCMFELGLNANVVWSEDI